MFGKIKSIFTYKSGLASPEPWLFDLFGATPTRSGPAVTPASAMTVPSVAGAVGLISDALHSLPCKTFMRSADGSKEPDREHPSYALVHDDANGWTSAGKLRSDLTRDALLQCKGGFAFANRVDGRVVEFLRLDPESVTVETDKASGEPIYKVRDATTQNVRVYEWRDILHIQAPGGVAPIVHAREAIGLAIVLERHAAQLFANGARPSALLREPRVEQGQNSRKLNADAIRRILASWNASFSGDNAGKTGFLEDGLEYESLSFNSVDSQFAEMRVFQILEIARAFRVAPIFLQEYGRATWANGEQMGLLFLVYTLMPWIKTWEAAYRRIVLSEADRKTHFIEFVTDGLLQADTEKRAEAIAKERAAGVITANEARALKNLPRHVDGDKLENPYTSAPKAGNDNAKPKEQAA